MRRFFILITSIFFPVQLLFSQTADPDLSRKYHELSASWDNDALMNTDWYYTQGLIVQVVLPCLVKNPVNRLFFQLRDAVNYYGIAVSQEMYTPTDIQDSLIIPNDRPYAGVLYFRSIKVSNNEKEKTKLTSQLDLGVLGPSSGAGYTQKSIHEINGLIPPNGWAFQLQNMPYINYNVMFDKGMSKSSEFLDVIYSAGARIGTVYDDIQLGLKLRSGLLSNYFSGVTAQDMTLTSHKDILAYFYGSTNVKAVLYNALLTGGMFISDNPHALNYSEISHFVGSCNAGIFIGYRGIGARFEFTGQSPEFKGGQYHGWFTTAAVISFY
jgi:hypothetical protein